MYSKDDETTHIGHMAENEKVYFKSTLSINYDKWEEDMIFSLDGIPEHSECMAVAIKDREKYELDKTFVAYSNRYNLLSEKIVNQNSMDIWSI